MMRAVLDTNVSIGACFAPTSASAQILRQWRAGRLGLVTSLALRGELASLAGKLAGNRGVRGPAACMAALLDEFDERAEWVEPAPLAITLTDRPDELVLGTAVAGHVPYLVTNDAGLLAVDGYKGIRILRPTPFLDVLRQEASSAGV
jgi:predicted nucleic acid-binding protein